ncbi:MAG: CopG family transcriptional regulator [Candidatus Heimdallarchaeota archaeon]|nr:CopG family transcriptional regulator [Candidatus Heimdallarchaeota archaeon]
MSSKYTSVSIPKILHQKIEDHIQDTGFTSVSSYVTFILRQILSESESKESRAAFTKEQEEKIKQRLRTLGYLD